MSDYTHIINGKSITSPTTVDVINPATLKTIAKVPVATKEQLDEAVEAARAALPGWSATPEEERAAAVNKIADILEQNLEEYKKLLTSEQGKPLADAHFEIAAGLMSMRQTAKFRLPEKVVQDDEQSRIIERRVPIGVCGAIIPWNFPVSLLIWKLAPSILAGNTIVIKPSPFTPLTTLRFIKDIQSVVPPGVVNALNGDDGLGPLITTHPGIDKVSFTGSTETGKKVMASASAGLKRLTLELGGNDPAIILPDVDVAKLVPEIFVAALINNGQTCLAAKRLYVHEKIYDRFRDELVKFAKSVKTGNGAESGVGLGPVQNKLQYQKVLSFFEDAHANGYKFALGGEVNPNPTDGFFIPVSFVDNPPEESKIVREEPFGPIVPLLKWSDEADVVKRANNTTYGLSATVWGKDLSVVERIARQIQAGTVCMNEFNIVNPMTAFGGHKQSGIGVESGMHGLLEYTNIQTITFKKRPVFA